MICGPQWSQGGLGEHRHPAGQIDVTDTTTLPDELDALKSADTQLSSQLTELSSKVEQAGGDKIGDIKVSVRTDLGDDWCLCNGDPIPDEYPKLVQVSGGLQLAGEWTPLADFKTNLSGQDYFVYENNIYTIQSTSIDGVAGIYLLRVKDFQITYTLLTSIDMSSSWYIGWAFMDNMLHIAREVSSGKYVYIHSAKFSLNSDMQWSQRSIPLWPLYNIDYASMDSSSYSWAFGRSDSSLYLASVVKWSGSVSVWNVTDSTSVKLSEIDVAITTTSNTSPAVAFCYHEFCKILEFTAYNTRAASKDRVVLLWYKDVYIGGAPDWTGGYAAANYSWTILDSYIYWSSTASGVTNKWKSRRRLTDGSLVNSLSESSAVPYNIFKHDDKYYMPSGSKICQVASSSSAPYFSLDEGVNVSGFNSVGGGVFFEQSNCYITGIGMKCALLPSISLSDTAYTYIKRK